ncbi:hypothetical protein FACS1894199_07560 [Bacteroidia bacterium]|nr:hypothetical protein FACS1894199_07560 [Bacteroidia bacterium]
MKEIGDNWRNRVIRAQHRLEDYAKETLPIVLIGKSIARQAIVENSIEGKKVKLIVNKNTFNPHRNVETQNLVSLQYLS